MSRRRGFAMAVCRVCGTAWTSRSARYCGHCGAALDVTETAEAGEGRPGAGRGRGEARDGDAAERKRSNRRRIVGIVLAAALLAVISIAAVTGDSLWEPDPLAEDPAGVELPDPEDVEDGGAEPEPADPGASPDGPVGAQAVCEPDDCALWAIPDPPGPFAVVGSILVMPVPGGDPEAPGDERMGLQGYSVLDGLPVWETALDVPFPDEGERPASVHPLGDEHLLVGVGGSAALLDAADGTPQWLVDLGHALMMGGALGEHHVLAVGEPLGGQHPDAPGAGSSPGGSDDHDVGERVVSPEVNSSVIDRATGEPVWTAEERRVVTVVSDRAIAVDSGYTRVEGLDVASGEVVWEREVEPDPRRALQAIDGERVALFNDAGLQVVDAQTGELAVEVDVDLSGDQNVQVVGDLVIVIDGSPARVEPPPRTGTLFDLREPNAEPETLQGLIQAVPLIPDHDIFAPWIRPEPTGVALAFQTDERYEVRVLDHDGGARWAVEGAMDEPACCIQVRPGGDDDRMMVIPPSPEIGSPTIVSTEDGDLIATIDLPEDLDPGEPLSVFDHVVVAREGAEGDLVIAGDAGYVRVARGSSRFLGPPVPVIEGPAGVLGIDPTLLLDEGLRREGGWHDGE